MKKNEEKMQKIEKNGEIWRNLEKKREKKRKNATDF